MPRTFHFLQAALGVLCLTGPQYLGAQREPAWVEQAPFSARPDARYRHAMAYYPPTGRTVLFGGRSSVYYTGTWFWQPFDPANPVPPRTGNWTYSSNGPSAREAHGMVFDTARNRITLFGGRTATSTYLDDTWVWSGASWQALTIANPPTARSHAAMAFDSTRNRIVLFGGFNGTVPLADTWEFDGTSWTPRFPATFPPPRYGAGMAFDARRDRIVLYGGGSPPLGDTWEYDGTTWSPVLTSQSPGPRYTPAMAFDALRGVTVLFGGYLRGNETWEYDGVTWHQRMTQLPMPYGRGETAMVFDSHRNRMVMFGGSEQGVSLGDTWEYHFPYGYETWGFGCAGSSGVPTLYTGFTSPGLLGQGLQLTIEGLPSNTALFVITGLSTSDWAGGPLPAELTPQGMPGCRLYVSLDAAGLTVASGTSASFNVGIPSHPMFLGFQLHHQALVLDPLAGNALGAVMTNAGTASIGN